MITIIASTGTTAQLKIGQQKPDIKNRIVSLSANGPELDAIRRNFINVPCLAKSNQCTWRGDWAQFIFDNLDET